MSSWNGGCDEGCAKLDYTGRLETHDARVSGLAPLDGDRGTEIDGTRNWKASNKSGSVHGVRFQMLYFGSSPSSKIGPYHAPEDDAALVGRQEVKTFWLV